jgi:LCP family protein required for cell wall assembly
MPPPRYEPPHRKARYWRVPRRRRLWVSIVGWSLWGLLGLVVAIGAGSYIYLDDTLEAAAPNTPEAKAARRATRAVLPGEPVNVLLIGSDTRPQLGDQGRSDSLILVRMDNKRGFISMLSFPRDLLVNIPDVGQGKINSAYSYGAATTIKTVEALTGEPVNEYVVVDFEGFAKLVDEVGGVYLDIDRRYYNKNIGTAATNYSDIDLQPGYQRLSGADALSFVRYRHTDSDYARIARQQQFLSELKRQTKDLGNLTNITSFRGIFAKNVEMSITSPRRFLSLLELALTTPDERIARVKIQGSGNLINGAAVEEASSQEIATKVAEWKHPAFEEGEQRQEKPVDPATVDVAVMNGSGRVLAAEDLADALRERRYNARAAGNADDFSYDASVVYYADGFGAAARQIRGLLGSRASVAPLGPDEANGNEVVVVAGGDWNGRLRPPPKPETRPPADTVDTTSLVDPLRRAQRALGLKVMVPMKVARGTSVKIVRAYRVNVGSGNGGPPAVKVVGQVYVGGAPRYWGIEMTSAKNVSILEGQTGSYTSGGREYLTYYDGRNLQRLAFTVGGVTYWVSNTLEYDLSAKTIEEIAKSMRPLNRARLKKGRTDTEIPVELEGSTP